MSRHRPAINHTLHTQCPPPLHFKEDPICKNKAPAFYQCICCLTVSLSPGGDTQRSSAQITPWGCHLPGCPSRPSPPGEVRTEQGGSKAFPASGALPPNPIEACPWSLSSGHCRQRHTIQEATKEKKCLLKTYSNLGTFFKHLCCGRKNTGLRSPPFIFHHEPMDDFGSVFAPLAPWPLMCETGTWNPMRLFWGLKKLKCVRYKEECHKSHYFMSC